MAKSLRSKWRRKCRAVKRVRYGEKELERLKKTLGLVSDGTPTKIENNEKIDISEIAEVKSIEEIKKQEICDEDGMEVDATSSKHNVKKLKNRDGAYPIWLHPRKIPKKAKKQKKNKIGKRKGKGRK